MAEMPDQLKADERRRLEALAQAVALNTMRLGVTAEQVVTDARRFDEWIREGGT